MDNTTPLTATIITLTSFILNNQSHSSNLPTRTYETRTRQTFKNDKLSYRSTRPQTTNPTVFSTAVQVSNIVFLPKSSCKLVVPTVEALSWEPSRCVLPFLASREVLVLSTVTWDGVLDGWLFTWEAEGWEAWLRASWRLLEEKGEREEMRSGVGQGSVADTQHHRGEVWEPELHDRGISGGVIRTFVTSVENLWPRLLR